MTISPELDRRFRDAAAASGLLDVAYDVVDSPVGPLFVAATERGVVRISYDPNVDALVDGLARIVGARVLRAPRGVDELKRELEEYFAHRRTSFDVRVDLRLTADFSRRVLEELARVPYGELATYGQLAARAGKPKAARAVGTVMNRNPIPIVLPCHRIVGSSGSLVGYAGGLERKQLLLKLEAAAL